MQHNLAFTRVKKWALPKLRPLRDARAKDAAAAGHTFHHPNLLAYYMSEYEDQPFAQLPGAAGAILRTRTAHYLRNESRLDVLSDLVAFEAAGNVSEDSPFDLCTGLELWAAMEQPRVRELTCVELGIPPDTPNAQLPANFTRARKAVIKREFAELSGVEQETWRGIAEARKDAVARGETDAIAVQNFHGELAREIFSTMRAKFSEVARGQTMIITWKACYSGAEDMGLHGFNGQLSNVSSCPSWFESSDFSTIVEPAWKAFAFKNMNPFIICQLPEMPADVSDEDIFGFKNDLQYHCEELFRLQSNSEHFNRLVFWDLVAERPDDFVAQERMPQGVTFCDPVDMDDDKLCAFYRHVWRCQAHRADVNPESRFIYKTETINYFTALSEARRLKDYWDGKKRESTESASESEPSVTSPTANNTTILEGATADADEDANELDAPTLAAASHDSPVLEAAVAEAGEWAGELEAPIFAAAPILDEPVLEAAAAAPVLDGPALDAAAAESGKEAGELEAPIFAAAPILDEPVLEAAAAAPVLDGPALDAAAAESGKEAGELEAPIFAAAPVLDVPVLEVASAEAGKDTNRLDATIIANAPVPATLILKSAPVEAAKGADKLDAPILAAEHVPAAPVLESAPVEANEGADELDAPVLAAEHVPAENVLAALVVESAVKADEGADELDAPVLAAEHAPAEHVPAAPVVESAVKADECADELDATVLAAEHVPAEHVPAAPVETARIPAEHVPAAPVVESAVKADEGADELDAPVLAAEHAPAAPAIESAAVVGTAATEAAQDADGLGLPSLIDTPDDPFLDAAAAWTPWGAFGFNAPIIEAGPDLEGAPGVSLPPHFAKTVADALANTWMRRARLAAHAEPAASPHSDHATVDDAAPPAPNTLHEQPTKRGGVDLPESSSKATKRSHGEDATARRADGM